jgi:hypothetical protein
MTGWKWMALVLITIVLWIDVVVIVLLFKHTLLGVVFATFAIPLSIGIYKEFISDWSKV